MLNGNLFGLSKKENKVLSDIQEIFDQNSSMMLIKILYNYELLEILECKGQCTVWMCTYSQDEMFRCLCAADLYLSDEICGSESEVQKMYNENPGFARPLSTRQAGRAVATISLIMRGKFKDAFHEFIDCIDDYGRGRYEKKIISVNEFVVYKTIITCFIEKLKENRSLNIKIKNLIVESIEVEAADKIISSYFSCYDSYKKIQYLSRVFDYGFVNVGEESMNVSWDVKYQAFLTAICNGELNDAKHTMYYNGKGGKI